MDGIETILLDPLFVYGRKNHLVPLEENEIQMTPPL